MCYEQFDWTNMEVLSITVTRYLCKYLTARLFDRGYFKQHNDIWFIEM